MDAYNSAVGTVKPFRDLHITIMTIHILGPRVKSDMGCGKIVLAMVWMRAVMQEGERKYESTREGIREAALRGTRLTQCSF